MSRVRALLVTLLISPLVSAAPAAAVTTISLTPQVWTFRAPAYDGSYQATATLFGGPSYGTVGRYGLPGNAGPSEIEYPTTDGDYASTLEFLLPDVPDNALITGASLSILNTSNQNGGDIEVYAYAAATTARDANRLNIGGFLTTFNGTLGLGQSFAPFDVTDIAAFSLQNLPANTYLGFSFRQTAFTCNLPQASSVCRMELGTGSSTSPRPVLSITYDIPTPPVSEVPEPASWAMMINGFGLLGGLMRGSRRRGSRFAIA